MEQLKKKRRILQKDAEALEAQADELAVKAEEKHDLTFITQSNSLRKIAEQKLADIKTVDLQLESIQQQCRDR